MNVLYTLPSCSIYFAVPLTQITKKISNNSKSKIKSEQGLFVTYRIYSLLRFVCFERVQLYRRAGQVRSQIIYLLFCREQRKVVIKVIVNKRAIIYVVSLIFKMQVDNLEKVMTVIINRNLVGNNGVIMTIVN